MRAILYSRWSSLDQSGTTSAPRQIAATEAFAQRQGWEVVERIADGGVSAWTGDNIASGNLGALIQRLEPDGGHDLALVVEKLDRLSRQSALTMVAWVQRACATGLTIATADGAHVIDRHRLERDQMAVIALIFDAFRGHGESQAKSERVGEAWARKRDRGVPMTRRCPAWLTIAPGATAYKSSANATAQYELIPERAAIVRRIFDMTAGGYGKASIAAQLNAEGLAAWGRGRGWHASYVQKIVRNPAVIGEYQPHTKPKGTRRAPIGPPIANYFPAVVPVELFERVNSQRQTRVLAQQSPNRLVNLFSGLAHCARCGASMSLLSKGEERLADGRRVPRRYLKCSAAHRAAECTNRTSYPYAVVEGAVLDSLLHVAMDDQHFGAGNAAETAEGAVASARRQLDAAERHKGLAYAMLEEDPTDELAAERYRQRREQVRALKEEVERLSDELARLRGAVAPDVHIARVAEVRQMLNDEDEAVRYEARARVKMALNDLVATISFEGRKRRFSVQLADNIRCLTFDMSGRCGLDIDWDEIRTLSEEQHSPAVANYLRRKRAFAA